MTKVVWRGRKFFEKTKVESTIRMQQAVLFVQGQTKQILNRSQPLKRLPSGIRVGLDPSKPGEPPKRVEGSLLRSITTQVEVTAQRIIGRVGTNIEYARFLELGTSRIRQRPYLRPALRKSQPALKKILTG